MYLLLNFCNVGQLVPVMPAVVAYQQYPDQHQQQELRSPTTGRFKSEKKWYLVVKIDFFKVCHHHHLTVNEIFLILL